MDLKHPDDIIKEAERQLLEAQNEQHERIKTLGIVLRLMELASLVIPQEELCQKIVEVLAEETGFENISILLYNKDEDCLKLEAARGLLQIMGDSSRAYNENLRFNRGEGVAWQVFESRNPVFIEDSEITPIPRIDTTADTPRALASIPIASKGVLNMSSSIPRDFPNNFKRDILIIAQVISHILQACQVHERLSGTHLFLQELMENRDGMEERISNDSLESMESACLMGPLGVASLSKDGTIEKVNPRFCTLLNCSHKELTGKHLSILFPEPSSHLKIQQAVERGEYLQMPRFNLLKCNGETFLADLYLHPIEDGNNSNGGGLLIIYKLDSSDTETNRFLREEKYRALGRMAAGIAHDFNNMLMAILGNVELMFMELEDTPHGRRLKNIEATVDEASQKIKSLLSYIGSNQDIHGNSDEGTDLNRIIQETVDLSRPKWKTEAERRGITIAVDLDLQDIPKARIPAGEFQEAVTSLIFNAVEALPNGGLIKIKTFSQKDKVIMEFSDNGIGMKKEVLEKIFDPYFTTKAPLGSGLGLSSLYGTITHAGGEIAVKSKEGEGTTFSISLPAVTSASTSKKEEKGLQKTKGEQDEKPRILVIDDEQQIAELLVIMLQDMGFHVTASTDSKEAIELIKKSKEQGGYDLILTDLSMPDISGLEIGKLVRTLLPETPVLLLTGWSNDLKSKEIKDAGISAIINKPFKIDSLLSTISQVIDNPA